MLIFQREKEPFKNIGGRKVRKEILHAGNFEKIGLGTVSIDDRFLPEKIRQFKAFRANNFPVEVTLTHTVDPDKVIGFVENMFVAEGSSGKNGVFADIVFDSSMTDDELLLFLANDVSVEMEPERNIGGEKFSYPISRIAIVNNPAVDDLDGWTLLASRSANQKEGIKMEFSSEFFKRFFETIAKAIGLNLEEFQGTEDELMDRIVGILDEKKEKKEDDVVFESDVKEEIKTPSEEVLELKEKLEEQAVQLAKLEYGRRSAIIDSLLKEGRLSVEGKKIFVGQHLGSDGKINLSSGSDFEAQVKFIRANNPVVKTTSNSSVQVLDNAQHDDDTIRQEVIARINNRFKGRK